MMKPILILTAAACLAGCESNGGDDRSAEPSNMPVSQRENGDVRMQQGWLPGSDLAGEMGTEQFVREAAMGNMHEIALGELALERSTNEQVRAFATRMIQDHTLLQNNLSTTARAQSIGMPMGMTALHQDVTQNLSGLEGARFDRAYMEQMVADHERTIALHERQARNDGNPAMAAAAEQALPVLRDHLREAQQILSRMEGTAAAPAGGIPQSTTIPTTAPQQPANTPRMPAPAPTPREDFVSPTPRDPEPPQ